ncbi:phage integrase family protein [Streptomyces viridochromogenes]|uniref:Phage integrase family protein n=1 Tax=Streptomyces viridochromogenes TaxID=1938 RepID=A0A0J8CG29_STRVR|nr:site-specific integrase [Streptomyces viridochromogenes]KMS76950.1 phage integrase family protein [Streptomyces viridochromogenes]
MDEWWLVFVPDPERWGPLPEEGVLGVRDLPTALDAVGLRPGDPVFVRPDFVVDAELLQFALWPDFRDLERESRRNYATDIRLLLSWLWRRGVHWRAATDADLRAYKEFRVDSPLNPQRVGGAKWNREAAALTQLYKWAKVSPLPLDVGRRADREASARSSRVSWLTPRTWGLWQDLGLRGLGRDGAPLPGWDGRTELRNTSFVGLALSSGLRRQEAGAMLTFEVPTRRLRSGRYCHGQVASALSRSKRDRTYYTSVESVRQLGAYSESERTWAIQRAQQEGRYEKLSLMRLVTNVTHGRAPVVHWVDRAGAAGRRELSLLDWRERQWLFVEGSHGPEPAWLWLTEQGMPMLPDRWNTVFWQANQRCEEALLTPEEREIPRPLRSAAVRGKAPYASPHAARHSMALYMLIVLNEIMDKKYGLTVADRRDFAQLYGDPWWLVKTLLGHRDVETTKEHYLNPVMHLQLESILAFDAEDEHGETDRTKDLNGLFAQLARETSGIQDIELLVDALPVAAAS